MNNFFRIIDSVASLPIRHAAGLLVLEIGFVLQPNPHLPPTIPKTIDAWGSALVNSAEPMCFLLLFTVVSAVLRALILAEAGAPSPRLGPGGMEFHVTALGRWRLLAALCSPALALGLAFSFIPHAAQAWMPYYLLSLTMPVALRDGAGAPLLPTLSRINALILALLATAWENFPLAMCSLLSWRRAAIALLLLLLASPHGHAAICPPHPCEPTSAETPAEPMAFFSSPQTPDPQPMKLNTQPTLQAANKFTPDVEPHTTLWLAIAALYAGVIALATAKYVRWPRRSQPNLPAIKIFRSKRPTLPPQPPAPAPDEPHTPGKFIWRNDPKPTHIINALTEARQDEHTAVFSCQGVDRERNEDYALAFNVRDHAVLLVADGCGGLPHGQRASRVATIAAAERIARGLANGEACQDLLRAAFLDAGAALADDAKELDLPPGIQNGGLRTTLIIAIASPTAYHTAYCGDGTIIHAPLEGDPKEIMIPQRGGAPNILACSLGPDPEGEPAFNEPLPRVHGDMLLVATDGIADVFEATSLAEELRRQLNLHPLQDANKIIVRKALGLQHPNALPVITDNLTFGAIIQPPSKP